MTQKDFTARIASETGMTKRLTDGLLQATVDTIVEALNENQTVLLQNFGTLSIKERPARTVRNPKTGEVQQAQAKRIVSFQVNPTLKQQVRHGQAE